MNKPFGFYLPYNGLNGITNIADLLHLPQHNNPGVVHPVSTIPVRSVQVRLLFLFYAIFPANGNA